MRTFLQKCSELAILSIIAKASLKFLDFVKVRRDVRETMTIMTSSQCDIINSGGEFDCDHDRNADNKKLCWFQNRILSMY